LGKTTIDINIRGMEWASYSMFIGESDPGLTTLELFIISPVSNLT